MSNYSSFTLLGQGGQGKVYKAYDLKNQRWVCIKKVALPAVSEKRGVLLKERLHHPMFVKTYDTYEDEKYFYHVMEYIEEIPILSLSSKQAKDVTQQLLMMLYDLKKADLTFNDIKPDNLCFDCYGRVYLIDFGALLDMEDCFSIRYGSVYFSSPEYRQKKKVDWQSDLYSIAKTVRYLCNQPSHSLDIWLKKAMRKDPNQRFKTFFDAWDGLNFSITKSFFLIVISISLLFTSSIIKKTCFRWCIDHQNDLEAIVINPKTKVSIEIQDYCLFHSLQLYPKLSNEVKLFLSNNWINTNHPLIWDIQKALCKDEIGVLKARFEFMQTGKLSSSNLQDEHWSFYLNYLCFLNDANLYQNAFEVLNQIENLSFYQAQTLIELAYILKDENYLESFVLRFKDVPLLQALCFYHLFQLGHYQEGYLHLALNLVTQEEHSILLSLIQQLIDEWGELA